MRCETSGRLTPAATTLIRISPAAGCGTARISGNSTSGPPGLEMPITVICAGSFSMVCPCENAENETRICLASRAGTGNRSRYHEDMMPIEDDDRPRKKISHEIGQDLSLLSVAELNERIALLTSGIEARQQAATKKRA